MAKKKTAANKKAKNNSQSLNRIISTINKGRDSKRSKGWLITFEGSEGSGKTTQIGRIATRFEDLGFKVVLAREPGGTEIGEEIRHLLKFAQPGHEIYPETELLLFAASRAQLVREVFFPSLKRGDIVLCDRFLDSTTVYQGVGRQIAADSVHMINNFAAGNIIPDVTVVIDLAAEIGFERIKHRATSTPDRLEQETIGFYRKVREGYLMLAKATPERFIVVDGTTSREKIEERIWDELSQRVI